MRDIYLELMVNNFSAARNEELEDIVNTYGDAAASINSALQVIGNLLVEVEDSEGYSGSDAKRDLLLIGSALRKLPRMAQVLKQNSDNADLELRKRQRGAES